MAPYSAYLEPCWAALEQGRPANMAGGQPAQQQPAQQGHPPGMAEQQGHTLAQQQGHKLGHPSWCRSASTAANKHGRRWAGTAVDTARTPTCRCNSAMAARTQFGTPGTAAASAARTPTEHSCIRNVAARTYFETPPKHGGRPASAARTSVGEQPVQQAGSNTGAGQPAQQHMTKNMGCPPGMSPQQQQLAPYSLLAWVPLSLRIHKHMAIPIARQTWVGAWIQQMAKAGGNMHSPADDSTPKFGGVPPHPTADQHHGMVNQNEQHGEPSHGSPPEPRPAEPHTPAIFGYLLILLAFILDLGILVLLRFGLVGLLFWTWAFQCCWVLVLLVFILNLGISVSLSFGLVGLYFGLGHFSVVEF